MDANATPAERHAAARALFESVPNAKFPDIARQVGVQPAQVKRWREEDAAAGLPWRAAHQWARDQLPPEVQALVDRFRAANPTELGPHAEEARTEAETEARAVAAFAAAVTEEAKQEVQRRHREEWLGPRALAYQAMAIGKKGNVAGAFELAKLAKISAETLTLVQAGECKAYGIDAASRGGDGAPIVVVERSRGPAAEAAEDAQAVIQRAESAAAPAPAPAQAPEAEPEEF